MTEKERVNVDFDSESYYLDGEYWESWDNYGEEMADVINKEFNKLSEKNKRLKKYIDRLIDKYRNAMTDEPSTDNWYCNHIIRDLEMLKELSD